MAMSWGMGMGMAMRMGRSAFGMTQSSLLASRGFSASSMVSGKIVNLEDGKDGVGIIRFDDPSSKVNSLSADFTSEFVEAVDQFEANPNYKALVLISGKKDNFIAGADINQLAACETAEDLEKVFFFFFFFFFSFPLFPMGKHYNSSKNYPNSKKKLNLPFF